jgi:hypothetical protein
MNGMKSAFPLSIISYHIRREQRLDGLCMLAALGVQDWQGLLEAS